MSNPQEPRQPSEEPREGHHAPPPPPPPAPPHYAQPGQYGAPGEHGEQPQYGTPGQQGGPGTYGSPGPYGPGPYGPADQYGMPAPRAKSRKVLWIVLGIVGGLVVLAVVGVLVLVNLVGGAANKARALSDEFTNLLIKGQTDEAYDRYMDPALMQQLDRDNFASGVQSLELDDTCRTNYSAVNVSSSNGTNATDVAGKLECTGKSIDLAYRFEGKDELKMVSIRLRPQG